MERDGTAIAERVRGSDFNAIAQGIAPNSFAAWAEAEGLLAYAEPTTKAGTLSLTGPPGPAWSVPIDGVLPYIGTLTSKPIGFDGGAQSVVLVAGMFQGTTFIGHLEVRRISDGNLVASLPLPNGCDDARISSWSGSEILLMCPTTGDLTWIATAPPFGSVATAHVGLAQSTGERVTGSVETGNVLLVTSEGAVYQLDRASRTVQHLAVVSLAQGETVRGVGLGPEGGLLLGIGSEGESSLQSAIQALWAVDLAGRPLTKRDLESPVAFIFGGPDTPAVIDIINSKITQVDAHSLADVSTSTLPGVVLMAPVPSD